MTDEPQRALTVAQTLEIARSEALAETVEIARSVTPELVPRKIDPDELQWISGVLRGLVKQCTILHGENDQLRERNEQLLHVLSFPALRAVMWELNHRRSTTEAAARAGYALAFWAVDTGWRGDGPVSWLGVADLFCGMGGDDASCDTGARTEDGHITFRWSDGSEIVSKNMTAIRRLVVRVLERYPPPTDDDYRDGIIRRLRDEVAREQAQRCRESDEHLLELKSVRADLELARLSEREAWDHVRETGDLAERCLELARPRLPPETT